MFLRRPRDRHSPRARRDRVSPETPRNLIHRRDISPARHVRAHLQARGRRRQGSRPLRPQEDLRPRASCSVGPPPRARGGGEGDRRRQKRPVPSRYPLRARTRRAPLRGRSRGAALAPRHGLRQGEGGIKPTNVTGFDDSIAAAKLGPIGGAVPCSDYKAWEKTIYGFIDGIKTGECPPAFKNATRAFLLKQDGVPAGAFILIGKD